MFGLYDSWKGVMYIDKKEGFVEKYIVQNSFFTNTDLLTNMCCKIISNANEIK